jgi:hypothetical protein
MSFSHITGLTVLANARPIDGKSILFDANLYLSTGETVVAALRYFNGRDLSFDDVRLYEIRASVCFLLYDSICFDI